MIDLKDLLTRAAQAGHLSYCPNCYPNENLGCRGPNEVDVGVAYSVLSEAINGLLREPTTPTIGPLFHSLLLQYRIKLDEALHEIERAAAPIEYDLDGLL